MTDPASGLARQLDQLLRADRGRVLSALIADLGDFDLAEEALSEAVESALTHWHRTGPPDRPHGWLLRVARRKAIDQIRRRGRWNARIPELTILAKADEEAGVNPSSDIPDERLRLIFTCCHPALDPKSRVALTLRTIGGLTTPEIARAFLDKDATMGQRLSRAKAKIAAANIPYAIPDEDQWPDRLGSVLAVIYLIFNEGYAATAGDGQLRADLCQEAIFLAHMLCDLRGDAETLGLLSLMLTTHARRPARSTANGDLIALDAQDRALWDAGMVADGLAALERAMKMGAPGPYQIKAAISALHVQAGRYAQTDWPQMVMLYDSLLRFEGSPVVCLNRAIAVAEAGQLSEALAELTGISDALKAYQPFHAGHAALLARDGQRAAAHVAYGRAIALSGTRAERAFLETKQSEL